MERAHRGSIEAQGRTPARKTGHHELGNHRSCLRDPAPDLCKWVRGRTRGPTLSPAVYRCSLPYLARYSRGLVGTIQDADRTPRRTATP